MKAADLFVKQLEEEGVKYIFGLPGEENLLLVEAIRKSNIKLIITRHEQPAAFMAATYGRLTGRAGVCLATLGPGALNLATGIAHAQLGGMPVVSISGQKALRENWQAKFQMVDVVGLMKPITKKAVSIIDAGAIPTVVRDAFKIAELERPGAVHLELPEDVAGAQTEAVIQKRTEMPLPVADKKTIEQAAAMINRAENPLLIISAGANRKMITPQLTDFVKKTGVFAVHTQMGKGVLSDESPQSLLATGIHRRDYVNCGIDRADLIITCGYNIVEYPPFVWNSRLDKKIINVDFAPADTDKYFNPDLEIIGDVSHTLKTLAPKLTPGRKFPVFEKTRQLVESKIREEPKKTYPPKPQEIVQAVRRVMAKDDIVALDTGIYKLWFSRLYKTYSPNTFLVDNALATMGGGLAIGICAKMLNPKKKVLAVVGDGGFMMNSQELETALRYKIPVVALIIRDDAYGMIKWEQKKLHLSDFALDFSNPDFVKYAESFGAVGLRVEKAGELEAVLKKSFSLNRVCVIDVPVDYSPNYEVFSKELETLVCQTK